MRLLLEGAATRTLTANGFSRSQCASSPDLLTILTAEPTSNMPVDSDLLVLSR